MEPAEVEVDEVHADHMVVVLDFLSESVAQASEPTYRDSHSQALILDVSRRDAVRIEAPAMIRISAPVQTAGL